MCLCVYGCVFICVDMCVYLCVYGCVCLYVWVLWNSGESTGVYCSGCAWLLVCVGLSIDVGCVSVAVVYCCQRLHELAHRMTWCRGCHPMVAQLPSGACRCRQRYHRALLPQPHQRRAEMVTARRYQRHWHVQLRVADPGCRPGRPCVRRWQPSPAGGVGRVPH